MWDYGMISREQFEVRKEFVERVLVELGAKATNLRPVTHISTVARGRLKSFTENRLVYEYRGEYFRVSEILFPDKPYIVIEWTDRKESVELNAMEDADPFPYDLGDEKIVAEVRQILNNEQPV